MRDGKQVAYLLNTYPAPTHTFIQREIEALEATGRSIPRYALRRPDGAALAGEADKVRWVLDVGPVAIALAVARTLATRPATLGRALVDALRLGRGAPGGMARHVIYLAEACVVREWAAADGIEHLHAHFATNAVAVALLTHRLGGPTYSFTVHGPDDFDHPREMKLGDKVAGASFVAAISSFGRSQVLRWTAPAHWDRVHIIRCTVDRSYLDAPITPVPDVPRFVSVGRLAGAKGQVLLIEAVARLRGDGTPVELVLIGDGELRAEIEAAVRARGLTDAVTLTGWLDNASVAEHMRSARAVVLASFSEGLPVTLMEALALGRPVVTTAIAGIPELVHDGETGWVVPASSIVDLVDAMRACLATPVDELDRMGKAGATAVAERHDATTEGAKLHALFDAVS